MSEPGFTGAEGLASAAGKWKNFDEIADIPADISSIMRTRSPVGHVHQAKWSVK